MSSFAPPISTEPSDASASAMALHDARPFFERVLAHGIAHGLISQERLLAMQADAPKGIVQIARYFGTEFLRPDLEKARERMVNMVGLFLQESTGGDLAEAARALNENSLLSRSKAGSDMLKQLITMPESSHFSMRGMEDAQTPHLALWSLRSHAEYRAELARRNTVDALIRAALWMARPLRLDADALEEAGADSESVIRCGLLIHALEPQLAQWPSALWLEKQVVRLRRKAAAQRLPDIKLPAGLPAGLHDAVAPLMAGVVQDLARMLDSSQPLGPRLCPMSALGIRYFLADDPLGEVDHLHRTLDEADAAPPAPGTALWAKLVQGHGDEHSLLTLFLCVAAQTPRKTLLTEKTAASLVRKIRKHGWQPAQASQFIAAHAPGAYQQSYGDLWHNFVQEATATLCSDADYQLHDALALLRRECHVAA